MNNNWSDSPPELASRRRLLGLSTKIIIDDSISSTWVRQGQLYTYTDIGKVSFTTVTFTVLLEL